MGMPMQRRDEERALLEHGNEKLRRIKQRILDDDSSGVLEGGIAAAAEEVEEI